METRSTKRGDVYESALRTAKATARRAVNPQRSAAQLSVWQKSWLPFCQAAELEDPLLRDVVDPVEAFEAFSVCLRTGQYSRSGRPISAKHVRDETAQVAKTFTDMSHDDPRFNRFGSIDKRLSNFGRPCEMTTQHLIASSQCRSRSYVSLLASVCSAAGGTIRQSKCCKMARSP